MPLDIPSYLLGKKSGGGGGTSDYDSLENKPQINSVTLTGDKSLADLGIEPFTGTDGVETGTAGFVPAPATTDEGKYLKSDGTWATAGGTTITYGNTDLTPGVSPLDEGAFYFYYE